MFSFEGTEGSWLESKIIFIYEMGFVCCCSDTAWSEGRRYTWRLAYVLAQKEASST